MLRTGFIALCLMFTLAGCGQKGDLYLPAAQNTGQDLLRETPARHHG